MATIHSIPSSLTFEAGASSNTITIYSTSTWGSSVTSGYSFITLSAITGTSGTTEVTITVKANTAITPRTGNVRFFDPNNTADYVDVAIEQLAAADVNTITKDGISISVPKFGWAFNPIIADCVNPNNVKITAELEGLELVSGDYYTLNGTNADATSVGYYTFTNGYLEVVRDENYRIYHRIPISTDKGLQMTYVGFVDIDTYFYTTGVDGMNIISVPGATLQSVDGPPGIRVFNITLPARTTQATIVTKATTPFTLDVGTFDYVESTSDLSVQVSRIGFGGKTQFELSGLSRLLFNRDEFNEVENIDNTLLKTLKISFSYSVGSSTTPIGSTNIKVIWGGLQIGEQFSQNRTYSYFKGYPFTVPLYLSEQSVVSFNGVITRTLNAGKYNIPIPGNLGNQVTITSTNVMIKVDVKDCQFGDTYLRWINHLGEWCYWLFKKTSDSIEGEASDIVFEQSYDTVNYVNNHHAGTGQYTAKKGTQTLNIAAANLDQSMYDFVREITLSPIVDLYDNGNWMRVTIGDSDSIKSNRVLQNIEIEVILPNLITQSL